MHILELYDFDGASGVSRVARTLTDGFRSRGHVVSRMLGRTEDPTDSPVIEPACLSQTLPMMLRVAWRIRRVVIDSSVDLVHAHHRRLALLAKVAMVGLPVPVVEHVHSVFTDKSVTSFRGDVIVCLSEGLSATLQNRYPQAVGKVRVCHNGVAVPEATPSFPSATAGLQLLVVGRVEPSKKPDAFVALLQELNDRGLQARGVWLGDGPLLKDYRARAAKYCTWPGSVTDVRNWVARSHCVVSMSVREGVPFALLDAMALGRPVLAAAVGGIGDLVDDSVGRLWTPSAPWDAIVESVAGFLTDIDKLHACGMRAHERVAQKWTSDVMTDQCERILRDAFERR